jgi:hypothetical protein
MSGRLVGREARRHLYEATSGSARIAADAPRIASLTFVLASGDFVVVSLPRYALERLVAQSQRALKAAPLPARRRLGGIVPATSRNK